MTGWWNDPVEGDARREDASRQATERWAGRSDVEREAHNQRVREGIAASRSTSVRDGDEQHCPKGSMTVRERRDLSAASMRVASLRKKLIGLQGDYRALLDCIREEDDPETQWRATATSKDIGNIKNALDVEIAERLRKDLMIPLYGRPPAHVATGTCRRVVRPGDVIGIYWAGDPGPASEKFYWRATVEEDGGYLYVASPDWPREPFHPREDWWVMLEQKSRKRRRGDDGLDDDDAQSSRVADAL